MTSTASAGLGPLDWAVVGAYFVLLTICGWFFARRQKSTREYFLGANRIPTWAAAVSFLATALSAATFIGAPQQAYTGDLTYLSANLGSLLAILIVAFFFVPVFYARKVATVYELLGQRFGPAAQRAAGATFLAGRVLASGARLYIGAIPLSLIVFGDLELPHLLLGIAALTVAGALYTLAGGIRSVIWTDVVQTVVFVAAVLAAFILLWCRIPADAGQIRQALDSPGPGQPSKLTFLRLEHSEHVYTLWTALFGFTLFNLAAYGADHDLAQRLLTCRSAAKGSRSAWMAILIGLPVTFLFMAIGLLLYVFYQRPELMGAAAPRYSPGGDREVFLTFILREMPQGLSGLMIAGLFAVSLGSLVSALNAMSASFVNDLYRQLAPGREDAHYLRVGRWGVLVAGATLGLFAAVSAWWQDAQQTAGGGTTLIDFALGVMTFAYSGLAAVFLTAIFTRRGSAASALAALIVGFASVGLMRSPAACRLLGVPELAYLAYPWQLVISVALSFGVCCLGRRAAESRPVAASDLQAKPATVRAPAVPAPVAARAAAS